MYQISQKTITKTFAIILILYAIICGSIIIHYQFTLLNSILLVLAGGGVVMLIDPLLKPIVALKNKKMLQQQKEIDKHIALAKRQGKKCFDFPKNNPKHTVWATNWLNAQKIYNNQIQLLTKKQPSKNFYYISETCNNLNSK